MSFVGFTLKDLLTEGTTYAELLEMLRADLEIDLCLKSYNNLTDVDDPNASLINLGDTPGT